MNAAKKYLRVSLDLLAPGEVLDCAVFLSMPLNGKMLRLGAVDGEIGSDSFDRYRRKGLKEVYILHPGENPEVLERLRQAKGVTNPDLRSLFDIGKAEVLDATAVIDSNTLLAEAMAAFEASRAKSNRDLEGNLISPSTENEEELKFGADGHEKVDPTIVKGSKTEAELQELHFGADGHEKVDPTVIKGSTAADETQEHRFNADGSPKADPTIVGGVIVTDQQEEMRLGPDGKPIHTPVVIKGGPDSNGKIEERRFSNDSPESDKEQARFKADKITDEQVQVIRSKGLLTPQSQKLQDQIFKSRALNDETMAEVSMAASALDNKLDAETQRLLELQAQGALNITTATNGSIFNEKSEIFAEYRKLQIIREACCELVNDQNEFIGIFASDPNAMTSQEEKVTGLFDTMERLYRSYQKLKTHRVIDMSLKERYKELPNILDEINMDGNPIENIAFVSERVTQIKEEIAKLADEVAEKRAKIEEIYNENEANRERFSNVSTNAKDDQLCTYTIALGLAMGHTNKALLRDIALTALLHDDDEQLLSSKNLPPYTRKIQEGMFKKSAPTDSVMHEAYQILHFSKIYVKRPDCITGRLRFDPKVFGLLYNQLYGKDPELNDLFLERARQFVEKRGTSRETENICKDILIDVKKTYSLLAD